MAETVIAKTADIPKKRRRWKLAAGGALQTEHEPSPPKIDIQIDTTTPVRGLHRRIQKHLKFWQVIIASVIVHLVALLALSSWAVQPEPQTEALVLVSNGSELESIAPRELPAPMLEISIAESRSTPVSASRKQASLDTSLLSQELTLHDSVVGSNHRTEQILALFSGGNAFAESSAMKTEKPSGSATGDDDQATFFGLRAAGSRFVFVVDCSLSMQGAKWSAAVQELSASVARLQPSQKFYVIFFDGERHRMFDEKDHVRDMLNATPENIQRLRLWLSQVQLGYNTSPCLSVKYAVTLKPDAIFLLSDGEFSDPTASFLRKNNHFSTDDGRRSGAAVHTIGFQSRDGQKMLQRIARENGGKYRFVP